MDLILTPLMFCVTLCVGLKTGLLKGDFAKTSLFFDRSKKLQNEKLKTQENNSQLKLETQSFDKAITLVAKKGGTKNYFTYYVW